MADSHVEHRWGPKALIDEGVERPESPFELMQELTLRQWLTFAACFLGWTLDAMAYFTVSLSLSEIAKDFGVSNSDVTASITLTLALRPVGALLFGWMADQYGRRWPLMIDVILFGILELASGFAQNLTQFNVIRAIFGIAMGGEWGLGSSLAMESLPPRSRGLFSGILQQGYAFGNLLATALYYAIVPRIGWRPLFWICSFPAFLAIVIRLFVPESDTYEAVNTRRKAQGRSTWSGMTADVGSMLKHHWFLFFYCIVLMSAFNFLSHGSQDLYPTFLKFQLEYSPLDATINNLIGSCGAIVGGTIIGYFGQYLGRRRVIIFSCIVIGALVYPWTFASSTAGLRASAFWMQFFVQGAWGGVPAHLSELAPGAARGLFTGLAYQLGNLVSSASAQIEAELGEQYPTTNSAGQSIPNYALTQAILIAIVAFILIILIAVGPENRRAKVNLRQFETEEGIETSPNTQPGELTKDGTAVEIEEDTLPPSTAVPGVEGEKQQQSYLQKMSARFGRRK